MTTYERLIEMLKEDYSLPDEKLIPSAQLEALGVDSLGVMELLFKVEDVFGIRLPPEQVELKTIQEVVDYIDRLVADQHASSDTV